MERSNQGILESKGTIVSYLGFPNSEGVQIERTRNEYTFHNMKDLLNPFRVRSANFLTPAFHAGLFKLNPSGI
jgi:hypothetical protein